MQKLSFIFLFLIGSIQISNAQDSGISVEIFYPIVATEEYQGDLEGVLGGAFQFQFSDTDVFNYGLEYKFDTSQATINYGNGAEPKKKSYLFNHINAFTKINIDSEQKLKGYLDGGFSVFKFGGGSSSRSYLGYNVGAGLSYDIMEQFYIFSNYNYVKASKNQNNDEFQYKETLQIIRFGIGYNI